MEINVKVQKIIYLDKNYFEESGIFSLKENSDFILFSHEWKNNEATLSGNNNILSLNDKGAIHFYLKTLSILMEIKTHRFIM